MSQKATDHAVLVITYSCGSLPVGAAISLVLWQLSSVSPTTLVLAGVGSSALVIALGTAARIIGIAIRDGASALPDTPVIHHHAPVYVQHNELHSETRGLGRTTNTQLPHS